MNTEITNTIVSSGNKAQYDTCAKRLLAQKNILAYILKKVVNEFKNIELSEIVMYIEDEPKIGIVPVESGLTNIKNENEAGQRVTGLNTESAEINEGMVRFDIIFYVRIPSAKKTDVELSKIIVNVEAQKDEPESYNILNRAIFYVCRLVSSQKERDFVKSNYDDIKKVFSIWICMNMKNNSMNHIHLTNETILGTYDWKGSIDILNIVLLGIAKELPQQDEKLELHRLLGTLLSNVMREDEKLKILEDEYKIPISDKLKQEVNVMCNLSDGLVEQVTERVTERVTEQVTEQVMEKCIINMDRKGFTINQIAEVVEMSISDVEAVLKNKEKEQ